MQQFPRQYIAIVDCFVCGQLVWETRELADLQSSNETHQFSKGHCHSGSHLELGMYLSDLRVCLCVSQLWMPGLNCSLPEGQLVVKAPSRTHTHTHTLKDWHHI